MKKPLLLVFVGFLIGFSIYAQSHQSAKHWLIQDNDTITHRKPLKSWNPIRYCWQITPGQTVESITMTLGNGVVMIKTTTFKVSKDSNCYSIDLNEFKSINEEHLRRFPTYEPSRLVLEGKSTGSERASSEVFIIPFKARESWEESLYFYVLGNRVTLTPKVDEISKADLQLTDTLWIASEPKWHPRKVTARLYNKNELLKEETFSPGQSSESKFILIKSIKKFVPKTAKNSEVRMVFTFLFFDQVNRKTFDIRPELTVYVRYDQRL